jgi:hypothetical protein
MTAAHSKIGASSMYRWSKCPGSVRLSEGLENVSSPHAEEGTKAHELAEKILKGEAINYETVDFEMLEHVYVYTNYVKDRKFKADAYGVEVKFDLSSLHPGLYGTCDAFIYRKEEGALEVVDLKYGAGIPVEAEDNEQLKYYALGALLKLDLPCTKVKMTIVQPRCFHPEGPVRSSEISAMELLEFSSDLIDYAVKTEDQNAPLASGDHCRFCLAAPICPKLAETALETAKKEFAPTLTYNPEELANALSKVDAIEAWTKNLKAFALREAEKGVVFPGFKLVEKRAHRKWKEDASVEDVLLKQFGLSYTEVRHPAELKSPAQIEALLGKEDKPKLAELVTKQSSGNTLVPSTDKRKTSKPAIETEFTKIEEQ